MKNTLFLLALWTIFACGSNTAKTETEQPDVPDTELEKPQTEEKVEETHSASIGEIKGYYVGAFEASKYHSQKSYSYSNKINISIDSVVDGQLYGHSVVAGNDRPFSGKLQGEELPYSVEAKEPGDDKYDGKFIFTINKDNTIKGKWLANNGKLAVYEREYELKKQEFDYDPNAEITGVEWSDLYDNGRRAEEFNEGEFLTEDATKYNASKVLLKKKDVENMYKGDLEIIRNSIYARHGYSFKNRKMRYVFDQQVDWYMPVSTDVRSKLTELEKKNIELLKRYEQHAERYYDSYGR